MMKWSFIINLQGQSLSSNPNFYLYNEGKDTIHFSAPDFKGLIVPKVAILDSIQIDGKGAKEIVFSRTLEGYISKHGGTFDIDEDIKEQKIEIWNLDTKQLLFEAKKYYSLHFNRFLAYAHLKRQKGHHFYSYELQINKQGEIQISNLISSETVLPDHSPGTYHFDGVRFVRFKDSSKID
ncbi:MAG: hypothetical protein AAF705_22300, partial [Bacteroidota bacterium]